MVWGVTRPVGAFDVPPSPDARTALLRIEGGPSFRVWEVRPVNSTARWPERLEHAATLLRAEGAAVVALRGGEFTTLFSYRIDPQKAPFIRQSVADRSGFARQ